MNWAIISGGATAHRFTVRKDAQGRSMFDAMCGTSSGHRRVLSAGNADHCAACEQLDDVPGLGRSFAQAFMPGAMAFMVRK